jgi:hypothetical protein
MRYANFAKKNMSDNDPLLFSFFKIVIVLFFNLRVFLKVFFMTYPQYWKNWLDSGKIALMVTLG